MPNSLDHTHDPVAQSWVASANDLATDFPLQNLPYGRVRRPGEDWRIGIAIGDQVLDLAEALKRGRWSSAEAALLDPLARGDLKALMAQAPTERKRFSFSGHWIVRIVAGNAADLRCLASGTSGGDATQDELRMCA